MENKHSHVTESEKKRHRKAVKRNRILIVLLAVVLVIGVGAFAADKFLSGLFNRGDEVPQDIRTARELQGDVLNILVCGLDYEEDRTAMMSDVIMYVSLDIKNNKVSAFQIPRDTYIGDDVPTGGSGKINGVYWHGKEENKIMNLIKVINDKLGLPVDHYVTLDMEAFIAMVDSIDYGLQMYVPYPIIIKDSETGKEETIIKEPGWYYVSGQTAERIVRNRNYPNRDIQRLEVQSYFYAAIIKNFTETLNISDFIKIMSRFTQYITTDMHWTKIASIAQFGFGVDYRDMTIIKPSLHGYDVIKTGNTTRTNVLVCEEENWAELLNEYCRPHQEDKSADVLKMPTQPPEGEVVRDYSATRPSVQTIADILAKSPENDAQ